MRMREFVGILPAAGTGSRLQPLMYPKELLPVRYEWAADGETLVPTLVIEHALASLQAAGISRCLIVVSDSKSEIARCIGDGARWGMHVAYVIQPKPFGLAHAVGEACRWLSGFDVNCCLALPDTMFDPREAIGRIAGELTATGADLVLGVFPTDAPGELGPVRTARDGTVLAVYDKPASIDLQNTWAVACWTPRLSHLLGERLAQPGGETTILGHVFDLACRTGLSTRAVEFAHGAFHDVGTRAGLAKVLGAVAPRPARRGAAASRARRHLLVAVHDRSWGRTELALRVGHELRAAGDDVVCMVHRASQAMMLRSGLRCEVVTNHLGGLVRLLLDNCVRRERPDSIVYFDFFNTSNYLLRMGIGDSTFLLDYDCSTLTLDTWDFERTGHQVDVPGGVERSLVFGDVPKKLAEFARIGHRLIPVPMAPCDGAPGRFSCLPAPSPPSNGTGWRKRLRVGPQESVVLFCTSPWQHQLPPAEGVRAMARLVPRLIAEYVGALGPSVHLVHVGPEPYPLDAALGERYHWQPPLPVHEFDALLGNCDLLVSPNVAATTIARAIQRRVPVLALRNSLSVHGMDDASALADGRMSPRVRDLLSQSLPLHPFLVWPAGYQRFLHPLLAGNPYCDAIDSMELLDESRVLERVQRLLHDRGARDEAADRQYRYEMTVRRLPSAADVVRSYCAR